MYRQIDRKKENYPNYCSLSQVVKCHLKQEPGFENTLILNLLKFSLPLVLYRAFQQKKYIFFSRRFSYITYCHWSSQSRNQPIAISQKETKVGGHIFLEHTVLLALDNFHKVPGMVITISRYSLHFVLCVKESYCWQTHLLHVLTAAWGPHRQVLWTWISN